MHVWPRGAWFGLTRPRARKIGAALLIFLAVLIACFVLALGVTRYRTHRAVQLVHELEKIHLGDSEAVARALSKEYGGATNLYWNPEPCSQARCEYVFDWNEGWLVNHLMGHGKSLESAAWSVYDALDNSILNRLGLRAWRVLGIIQTSDGKVTTVRAQIFVERPDHEWLDSGWRYGTDSRIDSARQYYEEMKIRPPSLTYLVNWHHLHMGAELGEGLDARLSPTATPAELRSAFNLNFACLTEFGSGCSNLCELAPDIGKYHDRLTALLLRNDPEPAEPRCK